MELIMLLGLRQIPPLLIYLDDAPGDGDYSPM